MNRLNRTLATVWAYRQIYTSNDQRATALALWLEHYTLNDATAHSRTNPRPAD